MARENKWITGNEVIKEVLKYRMWEIDEDISRNALKESGFNLSDSYKKWGKEHSQMIMVILSSKLNSMEQPLRKPYLISVKCNTDALLDKSVIEEVGQMIAIMVSVIAAIISITEKVNIDYSKPLSALFILSAAYWGMIWISSKFSYRDLFYEKIIDEILKEIERT